MDGGEFLLRRKVPNGCHPIRRHPIRRQGSVIAAEPSTIVADTERPCKYSSGPLERLRSKRIQAGRAFARKLGSGQRGSTRIWEEQLENAAAACGLRLGGRTVGVTTA